MNINNKGQTLIEVVLAVAIAVIVIYALVSLATISTLYAQSALRRAEAVKLANAGMESFRMERDIGGFDSDCLSPNGLNNTYIISSSPTTCAFLETSSNSYESITPRTNVIYRRSMIVANDGANKKNVMVTVKWSEGKSERKVSMTGVLTNWR
ncbi:MAG: prepilin-type N-terminal cleavage/methylation domain-containing protein [Patescibacteria group bacterium]|nr:prepilin-type N-terminal cleavage/methylation domain-containing protein [Patescibacteria group bacterium]